MNILELRQQAESGSVVAQAVLGGCYLYGFEVEVDYAQAFRFLSAAAEQGASRAIANLADMYAGGLGIPRDMSKATALYERAAKRGEFFAQIELGRIYSQGIGVAVDEEAALRWYSVAVVEEGDCEEWREANNYVQARRSRDDLGPPVKA